MKISRRAVGDRTLTPTQVTYPRAGRARAGPAHRRPAARHARRHAGQPHVSARRRIRVQRHGRHRRSAARRRRDGRRHARRREARDGERRAASASTSPRGRTRSARRSSTACASAGVDEQFSDFRINSAFTPAGGVQTVAITGPVQRHRRGRHAEPPPRSSTCRPATASRRSAVRAEDRLDARAPRLSPARCCDDEVETLMGFYQQGRDEGGLRGRHPAGAGAHPRRAARSLYRVEEEPQGVRPGAAYRISDLELASRLSFFLWSSIPDDELLDVGDQGPAARSAACSRSRSSGCSPIPKSEALTTNFAGQWLYLRELANVQTVGEELRRQPAAGVPPRNRDAVLDASSARTAASSTCSTPTTRSWTSGWRATTASRTFTAATSAACRSPADSPRRGLLGQGSMLTVTSVATRTSPVSRGKWILENMLGTPAPVPPPGVEIEPGEGSGGGEGRRRCGSGWKRIARNPVCASCHKIMDPIGFALENFDLVGDVARTATAGTPVDASGQLVDGTHAERPRRPARRRC